MAVKRIVDTSFWSDEKIIEEFSPEDKYFFLYLLTNPHTTQLGIYHLVPKIAAFELGYSVEAVKVLIDRFRTKYGVIMYSEETHEVCIKNFLKHSVVKGGKPVYDQLTRDLKQVKDRSLVDYIFNYLQDYTNLNPTVLQLIKDNTNL